MSALFKIFVVIVFTSFVWVFVPASVHGVLGFLELDLDHIIVGQLTSFAFILIIITPLVRYGINYKPTPSYRN